MLLFFFETINHGINDLINLQRGLTGFLEEFGGNFILRIVMTSKENFEFE